MPSVNEIRRVAKQVYNARSTVNTKKKNMMGEINGMYSWWDSSASHAFRSRYGGIDRDIQRVMNNLENLIGTDSITNVGQGITGGSKPSGGSNGGGNGGGSGSGSGSGDDTESAHQRYRYRS